MQHIKTFEKFVEQNIDGQEVNELFGGKLSKAMDEYKQTHADILAKIVEYDKELNPEYITLTKQLKDTLAKENSELAKKWGVNPNELYNKLDRIAIPTSIADFKNKVASGGTGIAQIASGAGGGRTKITA